MKGYIRYNLVAGMVVVYLDTWSLREIVSKERKARRASTRTLARLESGVHTAKVPQTVIGEAVATIMRDFVEGEWVGAVGRIMRAVAGVANPSTSLPPPGPEELEMAGRILDKIPRLGASDALIMAQTLLDDESQKLITRDALITGLGWLAELEQGMRKDGGRSERHKFEFHV